MKTTILNNYDNSIEKCKQHLDHISTPQKDEYSIIYINDYQLVNYENFLDMECNDLSTLEIIKQTEYKEKVKDLIDNSQNNADLINNIHSFIQNGININYLDNNIDIKIPKDDKIVELTTTFLQETNENTNSSTINLGKCKDYLKYVYNISEENNLYMLKIDTKQEGKNYPSIEYEVFYPINDEKMEILNLSLCEGMDIELSIPVNINSLFFQYC